MSHTFEELEIWKLWRILINSLWKIFYSPNFRNYGFQDQIMRAAISILNNIAEGRERWTNPDFIRFLYFSKWSIGEVRSMLYLANDFGYIDNVQFQNLFKQSKDLTIRLHNFIKSLS
jgi:four helix bundle protein